MKAEKSRKKKLSKPLLATIITSVVVVVLIICLLIVNAFIPLRYLSAYTVKARPNKSGEMRVNFINCDFGDCALVELPNGENMLIDGGDGAYPNMLPVLKFLNSRGVAKIDYLICTSVKSEHCGGLAEIVRYKTVKSAFVPYCKNTRVTKQFHKLTTQLTKSGADIKYGYVGEGVTNSEYNFFFTFLSPLNYLNPNSEYAELNKSATDKNIDCASMIVWLQFNQIAFAFTSDARTEVLKRLVDEYELCRASKIPFCPIDGYEVQLEKCKVTTVGGHGGIDCSYAPWYDIVRPEQAVVSVGKSFSNYPAAEAISNAANYCKPLYTMYDGDITFTVTNDGYTVSKTK